jgi:selenocysteine-specific elongation factor
MGHIVLAEGAELAPGEQALAQLHLEEPIVALPGDHFVARGFVPQEHYGTTIGGGEIVRVHAPRLRRHTDETAAALRRVAEAEPTERVALEVRAAGPAGASRKGLYARLGLPPRAVDSALGQLGATRELLRADGDLYLHAEVLARLEATALAAIDEFHKAQPHKEGVPREELRGRLPRALPPRLFDAVLDGLVRRGAVVAVRETVRRARHVAAVAASSVSPVVDKLLARLRAAGLEAPRPEELPELLGEPHAAVRAALDLAQRDGRLVKIRADYLVERGVLDALRDKLRAHLAEHGQITPQEWKGLTGVSRKFAIPLAEHFDAEKLTLHVGDARKLRG